MVFVRNATKDSILTLKENATYFQEIVSPLTTKETVINVRQVMLLSLMEVASKFLTIVTLLTKTEFVHNASKAFIWTIRNNVKNCPATAQKPIKKDNVLNVKKDSSSTTENASSVQVQTPTALHKTTLDNVQNAENYMNSTTETVFQQDKTPIAKKELVNVELVNVCNVRRVTFWTIMEFAQKLPKTAINTAIKTAAVLHARKTSNCQRANVSQPE